MPTQRLPFDAVHDPSSSGELAAALANVKRLRREAEEKAAELDRAVDRLRRLAEPADVPSPAGSTDRIPVLQPLRPVASPASDAPREALIRATQMAVAGSARSEIEATLREEYELAEASRIVEQILGPETDAGTKEPAVGSPTASSPVALGQD